MARLVIAMWGRLAGETRASRRLVEYDTNDFSQIVQSREVSQSENLAYDPSRNELITISRSAYRYNAITLAQTAFIGSSSIGSSDTPDYGGLERLAYDPSRDVVIGFVNRGYAGDGQAITDRVLEYPYPVSGNLRITDLDRGLPTPATSEYKGAAYVDGNVWSAVKPRGSSRGRIYVYRSGSYSSIRSQFDLPRRNGRNSVWAEALAYDEVKDLLYLMVTSSDSSSSVSQSLCTMKVSDTSRYVDENILLGGLDDAGPLYAGAFHGVSLVSNPKALVGSDGVKAMYLGHQEVKGAYYGSNRVF